MLFCDPAGLDLAVGQLVVIGPRQSVGGEAIATVVFTANQLVENEAEVAPSVRAIRLATAEDVIAFGRLAASEPGFTERVSSVLADADPGCQVIDVWLSTDGARLTVVVDALETDGPTLARRIEHELGIPVDLRRSEGADSVEAAGILAAGLPSHWTAWLARPGDPPPVRPLESSHSFTAREVIDRLFPPAERAAWERPRRRPEQDP